MFVRYGLRVYKGPMHLRYWIFFLLGLTLTFCVPAHFKGINILSHVRDDCQTHLCG